MNSSTFSQSTFLITPVVLRAAEDPYARSFSSSIVVPARDGQPLLPARESRRVPCSKAMTPTAILKRWRRSHETQAAVLSTNVAPGCGELSGTAVTVERKARRNLRTHVRPAPVERRTGLDQLGRGSDQHAVPDGERSGMKAEDLRG